MSFFIEQDRWQETEFGSEHVKVPCVLEKITVLLCMPCNSAPFQPARMYLVSSFGLNRRFDPGFLSLQEKNAKNPMTAFTNTTSGCWILMCIRLCPCDSARLSLAFYCLLLTNEGRISSRSKDQQPWGEQVEAPACCRPHHLHIVKLTLTCDLTAEGEI